MSTLIIIYLFFFIILVLETPYRRVQNVKTARTIDIYVGSM